MSKRYHADLLTGLAVQVGAVVIAVQINEKAHTMTVLQSGPPLNGEAGAIERAKERLLARALRVRPDCKVIDETAKEGSEG